jgi:hypothetical protein
MIYIYIYTPKCSEVARKYIAHEQPRHQTKFFAQAHTTWTLHEAYANHAPTLTRIVMNCEVSQNASKQGGMLAGLC